MLDVKYFYDFFPFGVFYLGKNGNFCADLENMSPIDIYWLYGILQHFKKPKMVAYEIGAWSGMSTCCIGKVVKECRGKLVTIDNFTGASGPQRDLVESMNVERILRNNLKRFGVHRCVEVKVANSNDCHQEVPDGSVDFIFIDGDHRYSQVKRDLDNWFPKVKSGGVIAGHDFSAWEYDERFIEEDCVDKIHHGVIKAVREKFDTFLLLKLDGVVRSSVWHHIKDEKR